MTTLNKFSPLVLGVLRIVSGYMFILHATAKFWEFPMSMTGGHGSVELGSIFGIGGIIELVFGALLILGLFSRVAAFILSGQMAVAYFLMHASAGSILFPVANGGEAAVLYCFIFLYVFVAGPGAFALDNRKQK
ncbi:MAG: DoxX family protein [Pasteurellaceae bacterium]|nr:DoxX family protein [Pasteurellaceae bacterium]